jgi:hypothetical protein
MCPTTFALTKSNKPSCIATIDKIISGVFEKVMLIKDPLVLPECSVRCSVVSPTCLAHGIRAITDSINNRVLSIE